MPWAFETPLLALRPGLPVMAGAQLRSAAPALPVRVPHARPTCRACRTRLPPRLRLHLEHYLAALQRGRPPPVMPASLTAQPPLAQLELPAQERCSALLVFRHRAGLRPPPVWLGPSARPVLPPRRFPPAQPQLPVRLRLRWPVRPKLPARLRPMARRHLAAQLGPSLRLGLGAALDIRAWLRPPAQVVTLPWPIAAKMQLLQSSTTPLAVSAIWWKALAAATHASWGQPLKQVFVVLG